MVEYGVSAFGNQSTLKETTGGEFRVCRASLRLLYGI